MEKRTLVIMAAGRGSRFGSFKQIEDVDGRGHRLMDYSVYDAACVGFNEILFIINPEIDGKMREIGNTYRQKYDISVDFALQTVDKIPSGYRLPEGRKKPWGTAHAVACLEGKLNSPFALINADDFYGRASLSKIHDFLFSQDLPWGSYAMVGYRLGNTLSDNGGVSRGVCKTEGGYLQEITERKEISRNKEGVCYNDNGKLTLLDPNSIVSVNLWGFTPDIIDECNRHFADFLSKNTLEGLSECEFYLPDVVSSLISEGKSTVSVIESDDRWCGMTYREDLIELREMLLSYTENGIYPQNI